MIWVYFLPVEVLDDTEQVAGIDIIHHALLLSTEQAAVRKLTMDTTVDEHTQLDPTQEELDYFNAQTWPPPDPGFTPLNPAMGVEHRLTHVEQWLAGRFPPPPQD